MTDEKIPLPQAGNPPLNEYQPGPCPQQPPPQEGYPALPGAYPPQPPPQAGYPAQPGVPPPPGYYPSQPGQAGQPTGVVVTQPVAGGFVANKFKDSPVTCACPHCQAQITTATHNEVGTLTHMVAGIVCLTGFALPLIWLGCCFIPYCMKSLKDVIHTCPNCNQEISRWNRLS